MTNISSEWVPDLKTPTYKIIPAKLLLSRYHERSSIFGEWTTDGVETVCGELAERIIKASVEIYFPAKSQTTIVGRHDDRDSVKYRMRYVRNVLKQIPGVSTLLHSGYRNILPGILSETFGASVRPYEDTYSLSRRPIEAFVVNPRKEELGDRHRDEVLTVATYLKGGTLAVSNCVNARYLEDLLGNPVTMIEAGIGDSVIFDGVKFAHWGVHDGTGEDRIVLSLNFMRQGDTVPMPSSPVALDNLLSSET